ncbi:hypothetical protein YW7DRAFT_02459 [Streptomyces sp. AmelKG-E11A]|nr:hypothetical protein YW7DRAFT_02459 [Streptomyces sp. AmelKG-E11A]
MRQPRTAHMTMRPFMRTAQREVHMNGGQLAKTGTGALAIGGVALGVEGSWGSRC